jgi:hypothetical protein
VRVRLCGCACVVSRVRLCVCRVSCAVVLTMFGL